MTTSKLKYSLLALALTFTRIASAGVLNLVCTYPDFPGTADKYSIDLDNQKLLSRCGFLQGSCLVYVLPDEIKIVKQDQTTLSTEIIDRETGNVNWQSYSKETRRTDDYDGKCKVIDAKGMKF